MSRKKLALASLVAGAMATIAAPTPKRPPRDPVILVTSFGRIRPQAMLLKPDGSLIRVIRLLDVGLDSTGPWMPRISPDGQRLLITRLGPLEPGSKPRKWTPNHLHIVDLDAKTPSQEAVMYDLFYPSVVWATNGRAVIGSHIDPEKIDDPEKRGQIVPLVSWTFDPASGKKSPLALPTGHAVIDITPDGKTPHPHYGDG